MGNATVAEVTGKIMVVAIIILFLIVIFLLFLHLYAKWFWWQTQQPDAAEEDNNYMITNRRRPRYRFVFTPNPRPLEKRGLDPALLSSLPVLVFNPSDGEVQECAVCLCELDQGDKGRMLPNCNHAFHVECIDMWFQSHSTCPLCRNTLKPDHPVSSTDGSSNVEVAIEREMLVIPGRNINVSETESSSTTTLSVMMSLENEEHKSLPNAN